MRLILGFCVWTTVIICLNHIKQGFCVIGGKPKWASLEDGQCVYNVSAPKMCDEWIFEYTCKLITMGYW